jgi:hypothetical protein
MSFIKINETTSVNTSNIIFMKSEKIQDEPALTIAFVGGITLTVLEKDMAMSSQNTWTAIIGSQLRR